MTSIGESGQGDACSEEMDGAAGDGEAERIGARASDGAAGLWQYRILLSVEGMGICSVQERHAVVCRLRRRTGAACGQ